ncbi:MAG TPA: filamentous hemagglutinin N-terminal domain-containing protein, partial [Gammaproteobacteria bacterium]
MNKRMPVDGSISVWMQQIWVEARLRRGVVQAAGALGALAPVLALANPTGGQVVAGTATIGTAGNGVIINQGSQRAAINWQQFSVGSNEYVQFNQPNSSSVVLNRVIGSNPSGIFGQIHANGQVFLINPNGILFAPGSSLDVSGLTASTLDISDADFMAGRYVFSRAPGSSAATVVNQGNLQVSAGGYVVLAGDYVENDGVINAVSGRVVLAAGGAATLSLGDAGDLISYKIDAATLARLAGVDNAGSIVANGGSVVMTADVANALTATAVNNSGLITAHSVRQQGGEIMLLSQGGDIENSGTLDA